MNKILMNVAIVLLVTLVYFDSFGMLTTQPKTFYWKNQEDSTEQNTFLPKELLLGVGIVNRQARNKLQSTCKDMQTMLSIKSPHGYKLLEYSVGMNKEDKVFIGFNAVWDNNHTALQSILRDTNREIFTYGYNYYSDSMATITKDPLEIGFRSIIKSKMNICADRLSEEFQNWQKMHKIIKEAKCDFGYTHDRAFPLSMASYLGDVDSITKIGTENYAYPQHFWEAPLLIAIDKNNPHCIHALADCMKNNNIVKENHLNSIYYRYLVLEQVDIFKTALEIAMRYEKNYAFEALVKTDIFNILNSDQEDHKASLLDWLITQDTSDSQRYVNVYRKHCGKTYEDLKLS